MSITTFLPVNSNNQSQKIGSMSNHAPISEKEVQNQDTDSQDVCSSQTMCHESGITTTYLSVISQCRGRMMIEIFPQSSSCCPPTE